MAKIALAIASINAHVAHSTDFFKTSAIEFLSKLVRDVIGQGGSPGSSLGIIDATISDAVAIGLLTETAITQLLALLQSSQIYDLYLTNLDALVSSALKFLTCDGAEDVADSVTVITNSAITQLTNAFIASVLGNLSITLAPTATILSDTPPIFSVTVTLSIISQDPTAATNAVTVFGKAIHSIFCNYMNSLGLLKLVTKKRYS